MKLVDVLRRSVPFAVAMLVVVQTPAAGAERTRVTRSGCCHARF